MTGKTDRVKTTEAAERLVKSGKIADAVAQYEKLLEGTAQDIPTRNIIGDLLLQIGREDRALRLFRANVDALETQGAYSQALALGKRIFKLMPDDREIIVKLGDLYSRLGFAGEARAHYLNAAETVGPEGEVKVLIALYEKLIGLDRSDLDSRLKLSRLLVRAGSVDRAASELNETADLLFVRGDLDEARRILQEARKLKDGDARTLSNLARLLVQEGRADEAVAMVEESVHKHGSQPALLALLGDLLLGNHKDARAGEVFAGIIEEDPDNADARTKLGIVHLRAGRPDEAYSLYEPMVVSFLNRSKEEQAAGLLGLILLSHPDHLPSLEKLAAIFRRDGRSDALEPVLRTILAEAIRQGRDLARRKALHELAEICPTDQAVQRQWQEERRAEDNGGTATVPPHSASLPAKDQDIIRTNLAKSDVYLDQGLIRNARRILDNLVMLYPDDVRILEKIGRLPKEKPPVAPEDLASLVDRLAGRESPAAEEPSSGAIPVPPPPKSRPEDIHSDTVSLEEIFGSTDLTTAGPSRAANVLYPDLTAKIREELEALEASFFKQIKDKTAVIEKDLSEIVAEFQRQVEQKIERTNHEARYNLGLAFFEQGLLDEAVAEFELAAKDPERTADCYALIGRSYKSRRNYREALRWIDEALRLAQDGTDADYALTFERAELLEDINENVEALRLFRRVKAWNARYRNVSARVKILEKII